jgi:hypothetical protein
MQLIAEQIERVYADIGNSVSVDRHQTWRPKFSGLTFLCGRRSCDPVLQFGAGFTDFLR